MSSPRLLAARHATRFAPALLGAAVALFAPRAAAEDEVFARVIVDEAELRAGPGASYRVLHRAVRGDSLVVTRREAGGYWLEVQLPDGRTGYLLGEVVEPVAVGEDSAERAGKPGFFAPPALEDADAGFALLGGAYAGDGYAELRPALVLAPAISFEPYAGLALGEAAKTLVYGAGFMVNLAPDWAIAPYVVLGAGGARDDPNSSDEFVRSATSRWHARAGGGLLLSLRWRILVRLEATNLVLFTEDSYENVQGYLGGLGTYF
ncbi:MAG: SH3 domain-containing protein [Polyangiaceae bacterium]|nr:SH3 domain-containing protein [Polyangiaceae bacterium]